MRGWLSCAVRSVFPPLGVLGLLGLSLPVIRHRYQHCVAALIIRKKTCSRGAKGIMIFSPSLYSESIEANMWPGSRF